MPQRTRISACGGCLLLASLVCLVSGDAWAAPWRGKVVGVADGDTITVLQDKRPVRIRLQGVDTPEKAQAFGQRAKKFTAALVAGKQVRVTPVDQDRYGRLVAVVHQGAKCLNEALLLAGLAWHYKRYSKSKRYAALELEARGKKRGLWSQPDPTPPWRWRRQNKGRRHRGPWPRSKGGAAAPGKAAAGPFHGNLKSKIFHAPGCRSYNCKNCRVVFARADQAEAEHYKGHEGCTAGHPAIKRDPRRVCKADADCVLAFRTPCSCAPCGKAWRRATNRKAYQQLKRGWAIKVPRCKPCTQCMTQWRGRKAVCVKGQCAVR